MDDLLQQAKLCGRSFIQWLEDIADWIGPLDSLVALLGALLMFFLWLLRKKWPDPVNLGAVIDDLLKDKVSLQSKRDSLKKQLEKAAEELPAAGAEEGRFEDEIWKAQAALVTGDNALAESIYRARLHRQQSHVAIKQQESQAAVKQLAETHRNLGALAFLHDTQLALDHYQQSTVLDADDPDGWNQLGHLLQRIGELSEAENAYQQVLRLASSTDDGRELKAAARTCNGNQVRKGSWCQCGKLVHDAKCLRIVACRSK